MTHTEAVEEIVAAALAFARQQHFSNWETEAVLRHAAHRLDSLATALGHEAAEDAKARRKRVLDRAFDEAQSLRYGQPA